MNVLKNLGEDRVFSYFEAISAIPRGRDRFKIRKYPIFAEIF